MLLNNTIDGFRAVIPISLPPQAMAEFEVGHTNGTGTGWQDVRPCFPMGPCWCHLFTYVAPLRGGAQEDPEGATQGKWKGRVG